MGYDAVSMKVQEDQSGAPAQCRPCASTLSLSWARLLDAMLWKPAFDLDGAVSNQHGLNEASATRKRMPEVWTLYVYAAAHETGLSVLKYFRCTLVLDRESQRSVAVYGLRMQCR